jgi:hypothetical protein
MVHFYGNAIAVTGVWGVELKIISLALQVHVCVETHVM